MKRSLLLFQFFLLAFFSSQAQSVDIATNPGTSGNALIGGSTYHSDECLYGDAEIGTTNFTSALTAITHISYSVATVGTNPIVGSFSVYMKDVSSTTTSLVSGTYDALSTYTLVYSGSFNMSATGWREITLTTPYVRTSGTNLKVLVVRNDGILHTGNVINCSLGMGASSTLNTTKRYNSTTIVSGTTVLSPSTFRNALRLAHKFANDVKVANVYTMGKLPIPHNALQTIKANITNVGVNTMTNFNVTLDVSGANTFSDVQTVASLAPGASTVVTFSSTTFTSTGTNVVSVTLPSDDDITNNVISQNQEITTNTWSYAVGGTPTGGVGFNGATGDFIAKFTTTLNTLISQVAVNFSAGGQPFQIGIWDATGANGTPGTLLWTSTTQTSTAGLYILPISPSVTVPLGNFYVGVRQTGTVNVSFAYQSESPIRGQTFYYTSPSGSTTWNDFAPNNPFRFMIEPTLEQTCTGTPNTATASGPTSACNGISFNLTSSGFSIGTGVSYQWESSPAGQNSWTPIIGANNTLYSVTTLNGSTDYHLITTCNASGATSISNTVTVNLNNFYDCYCASSATTAGDEEIYSVTLNGVNSNSFASQGTGACFLTAPGAGSILSRYSNFKSLGSFASLMQGATVPFNLEEKECDGAPYYAFGSSIWIDFNQNGSFADPGEQVFVENASATGPRNVSGSIAVPVNTTTGMTGMRVTIAEGLSGASLTPCLSYGYGETEDYLVTIIPAVFCSGTPNTTTITGPSNTCVGNSLSFLATGYSTDLGISYSWESSPAGQFNWTPISGATGVGLTIAGGITSATDFRFVTTCSYSTTSSYSNEISVTMNSFINCYCAASSGGGSGSFINQIDFGTISNNTVATNPSASPYYTLFSNLSTTVSQGSTIPLSVTIDAAGTYAGAIVSVWIDYNHDGVFSATEWQQVGTNILGSTTATIGVTIPLTADTGITAMRIRSRGTGNVNGSGDACTAMGSGETEDYYINILQAILCSGTPNAAVASGPSNACTGTNFILSATGVSTEYGISYQWESSPAGQNNWTAITGATSLSYTVTGGITASTDYRFVSVCSLSSAQSASNTIAVTLNSFYQCYCSTTNGGGAGSMMDNVVFGTISNNTSTSQPYVSPYHSSFPNLTTLVSQGATYPLSVTIDQPGTYAGAIVSVWIDYNQDGTFSAAEWQQVGTNIPSGTTGTVSITIPLTALTGTTGMRIRSRGTGNANGSGDACTTMGSGETEDYIINIGACPTASVSIATASTSVCSGFATTFTASPVNGGPTATYVWSVNGNAITGVTGDNYSSSSLNTGDIVSVSMTNFCGNTANSNSLTMSVTNTVTPTASINASATSICAGTSVSFTSNTSDGGSNPTYQWYVNGNAIAGETNNNYTTSSLADGDMVTMVLTTSATCYTSLSATSNFVTMSVTPLANPSVTATESANGVCAGASVSFYANGNDGGSNPSYQWMLNGNAITGETNSTYSSSSLVNGDVVSVSMATSATCYSNASANSNGITMVINPILNPTVSIAASATSVCIGTTVNFTSSVVDGGSNVTYQWMLNGSPINGATNDTYTATAINGYDYSLEIGVTSPCASTATATSNSITINATTATGTITPSGPLALCAGGNVTLTAGAGSNYLWSNGATTQSITVNAAGTYHVTYNTGSGCAATAEPINVLSKTLPTIIKIKASGATTVCDPATIGFSIDPSAASLYGFNFQWNLNGTPISGATDTTYLASGASSGNITLSVSGSTCSKNSAAKTYTIKPLPVATYTAGGATTFCTGGSVTLTAPTITGYTYTWLKDGLSAGAGNSKVFKLAGVYTVIAKLSGCADTANTSTTIVVNPLPVASVTSLTPTTFCTGDSCVMAAAPSGATNYAWINGLVTVNTSTENYVSFITGTYKVVVTDANGCVSKTSTSSVKTKVNLIPTALITALSSTTISATGSVKLNASPSSGVTWQWSKDGNAIAGATTKQYIATSGGSYTVAITKLGCTGTSAATVVTQTGVKEETGTTNSSAMSFELSAYPNPVTDVLTINVQGIENIDGTIQVMDYNGRLMTNKEMKHASTTVDMTGFASGVYLVRYKDNEGRTGTIKITKQ